VGPALARPLGYDATTPRVNGPPTSDVGSYRIARSMKRALVVLSIIAAIGAGGYAYYIKRGDVEIGVATSPITRGDIIDSVAATGTLQAVTTVQVGSQVSGNISYL